MLKNLTSKLKNKREIQYLKLAARSPKLSIGVVLTNSTPASVVLRKVRTKRSICSQYRSRPPGGASSSRVSPASPSDGVGVSVSSFW